MHNPFENNLIIIEELREHWSYINCVDDANVVIVDTLIDILAKINDNYSKDFVEEEIYKIIDNE